MATTLRRMDRLMATIGPFVSFFEGSFASWNADPSIANFAVGNPQEMPLPGYVDALRAALTPRDKDWFAYKMSEPNVAGRGRPQPDRADGPRLGSGRRGDDQRRLRGPRGRPSGRSSSRATRSSSSRRRGSSTSS